MNDADRALADIYARVSVDIPVNAHYNRPASRRLVGDIQGKRVLDLGCAAGLLTEQLADRGADVLAVDREPRPLGSSVREAVPRACPWWRPGLLGAPPHHRVEPVGARS